MTVKIIRPPTGGSIRAIPSKSQVHRLLICAALADFSTYIGCDETSADIDATAGCLVSLGASVMNDGAGFEVEPIPLPVQSGIITQNCFESGSTLRFMLPLCCALGASAEFIMSGRLPERPMGPLLEQLTPHGCSIVKSAGSLCCGGKLEGGVFTLPGDISSQFISGLLLALPRVYNDSVIKVEGRVESLSYIDMTMETLGLFGIKTGREGNRYMISGGQRYRSPGTVAAEGDWSNAAFWLCAGAIGGADGGITCTGLNSGSRQGDKAIVQILKRFGARVECRDGSVTAAPGKLRGTRIDAGDIPDLIPVLSVVAAVAEGETEIYNAGRLRMKESNRLRTTAQTLRNLGADISETEDGLRIRGVSALRGGTVASFGDHRIAMTAAVASAVCKDPVTISGAEAVKKSYPAFFRDFMSLGGEADFV